MQQRSIFDRLKRKLLRWSLKQEHDTGVHFMTSRARPKMAESVGLGPKGSPSFSVVPIVQSEPSAIVMQGPVAEGDNFTLETLRIYAEALPQGHLILSTWRDTPRAFIDQVAELGVDVVLNDKPDIPGPFNVNMQITSAAAGVRKAIEHGATWILKTRTDQRLYHPVAISGLAALAKALPPSGTARDTQRYRVFGVGSGTLKFAPYHLCDQTVFGHADDMLAYWTPPLHDGDLPDGWPETTERQFLDVPIGTLCRHGAAETYLTSQFLLRMGRQLDWTLVDSWAAMRDHFGTIDQGSTDFYWVKGQSFTMRDDPVVYSGLTNRAEFTFLDWMQLYSGQIEPAAAARFENILSERFTPFDPGYP